MHAACMQHAYDGMQPAYNLCRLHTVVCRLNASLVGPRLDTYKTAKNDFVTLRAVEIIRTASYIYGS